MFSFDSVSSEHKSFIFYCLESPSPHFSYPQHTTATTLWFQREPENLLINDNKNTSIGCTGWERTVQVTGCPDLYSGRIFVPICRVSFKIVYFCVSKSLSVGRTACLTSLNTDLFDMSP